MITYIKEKPVKNIMSEDRHGKKRCFGNCCSEAASAYGRFYEELGERSLSSIEPIKSSHPPANGFTNYAFTAIQATVFGAIPEYPSIHPAVRGALAAVAQSCACYGSNSKCCCEVVNTIVDTALGYADLALTTVLTTPDDGSVPGPLFNLAVGVTSGNLPLFGIIPPEVQGGVSGITQVLPIGPPASLPVIPSGDRVLGILIASFINTLRVSLDSFCPKALKLYDSWDIFVPGVQPVPPLPSPPVTPPVTPPISIDERIEEEISVGPSTMHRPLTKRM